MNSSHQLLKILKKGSNMEPDFKFNMTIDIIIPIYNALDFAKKCIETTYEHTDIPYNLILINDCSTDKKIHRFLEELKKSPKPIHLQRLRIIHNKENMGFVKSVNQGIGFSSNHVILLNSDTEVPPGWASRLILPIISNPRISSVTPFSNSATICSFPNINKDNDLPQNLTVNELDHLFKQYGSHEPISLPTGHGFCIALNRETINKIGVFDAKTFGKGYGEENDWCMRAYRVGYRNVLIPNLFVYHKHGASFNKHAKKTKLKNVKKVRRMYPAYAKMVEIFVKNDPLKEIRNLVTSIMMARVHNNQAGVLTINYPNNENADQSGLFNSGIDRSKSRFYRMTMRSNILIFEDLNYTNKISYNLNIRDVDRGIFKELVNLLNIDHISSNNTIYSSSEFVYKYKDVESMFHLNSN